MHYPNIINTFLELYDYFEAICQRNYIEIVYLVLQAYVVLRLLITIPFMF